MVMRLGWSLKKIIAVLLFVWLVVVIVMTGPLLYGADSVEREQIMNRLNKAIEELDKHKKQNDQLKALLTDIKLGNEGAEHTKDQLLNDLQVRLDKAHQMLNNMGTLPVSERRPRVDGSCEPTEAGEALRRKVLNGVYEWWYYLEAELKKLTTGQDDSSVKTINSIIEMGADHRRVILHDLKRLGNLDGLDSWRAKEAKDLGDLFQNRLNKLQNPPDCSTAKKIKCNLNKGCGYGCQLHHVMYCFTVAYGLQRTLILESKGWKYNRGGWEMFFQPLSETCTSGEGASHASWPSDDENVQVLNLPIIDSMSPRAEFVPQALPKDIFERLHRLHGDPFAWLAGQFVTYLLRPQKALSEYLAEVEKSMQFKTSCVGIHIRRTDKLGSEAAFHSIEEYMVHAEEYFVQQDLEANKSVDRLVYIASDDPNVLGEARKKYENYRFMGDADVAKSAAVHSRYSESSLRGVIADIHMLSKCSYLVCTFSSQVCRVAYEIMQSLHPDASTYYRSLDDIYYFGGQSAHDQRALYAHNSMLSEDIELSPGDVVGIAGNHWNGFSKGMNKRTHKVGLYPSYKAEEIYNVVQFPDYKKFDNEFKAKRR